MIGYVNQQQVNGHLCMKNNKLRSFVNLSLNYVEPESSGV